MSIQPTVCSDSELIRRRDSWGMNKTRSEAVIRNRPAWSITTRMQIRTEKEENARPLIPVLLHSITAYNTLTK